MQDLARGIQRQRRDHDDIISRFETVKSHVEQYEARSAIVNRVVDGIQGQIRNLPASSDQMQPAVRRELGSLRSTLEGVMRRVSAIDGNVRTLGAANNRIMSQLFEMEGQFDEAAGIIRVSSRLMRLLNNPERDEMLATMHLRGRDIGSGLRRLRQGKVTAGVLACR